tara:strand:+ start:17403 stop:17600 length:198 start_codon:yes stop_codon:yes gene_type:complete
MKEIEQQALKELEQEEFREAVEMEKQRLKTRVPLLHRLFPWKIKIERRGHVGHQEGEGRSGAGSS